MGFVFQETVILRIEAYTTHSTKESWLRGDLDVIYSLQNDSLKKKEHKTVEELRSDSQWQEVLFNQNPIVSLFRCITAYLQEMPTLFFQQFLRLLLTNTIFTLTCIRNYFITFFKFSLHLGLLFLIRVNCEKLKRFNGMDKAKMTKNRVGHMSRNIKYTWSIR